MSYKAIIFDFFDVIAPDFYRVWLEREGYKREGEFLAIAQAIDKGEIELEEYYKQLSHLGGMSAVSIREEFETKTQLNEAVLQLIDQLHQDYSGMVNAHAWMQDFTYLWFRGQWYYLAVVLDLKTRQVAGWTLGARHSSELTLAALQDALSKYPSPAILHSDQGSEYLAHSAKSANRPMWSYKSYKKCAKS